MQHEYMGLALRMLGTLLVAGVAAIPTRSQPISIGRSAPPYASFFNPTDEALEMYARLTGKTVLRPANLRPLPASIKPVLPADTNDAIAFIVREFAKSQMVVIPDGETFARVLPTGWTNSLMSKYLSRLNPPPSGLNSSSKTLTRAVRMNSDMCLDLYSTKRNRTILQGWMRLGFDFSFSSQSPLTNDELVYALTVVFAMNGMALIDDGDYFTLAVPLEELARVKPGAPQRIPGEPLLDPGKLPAMPEPTTVPQLRRASISYQMTLWYIKLTGKRPPWTSRPPREVDRLAAFYAKLTQRKALASDFGRTSVRFKVKTPLTKPEVLYAIETTLALNNLAIIPIDEKSIRVGPMAERAKPVKSDAAASPKPETK